VKQKVNIRLKQYRIKTEDQQKQQIKNHIVPILTGMLNAIGSTGILNGAASGSISNIRSRTGLSAWNSSSCDQSGDGGAKQRKWVNELGY